MKRWRTPLLATSLRTKKHDRVEQKPFVFWGANHSFDFRFRPWEKSLMTRPSTKNDHLPPQWWKKIPTHIKGKDGNTKSSAIQHWKEGLQQTDTWFLAEHPGSPSVIVVMWREGDPTRDQKNVVWNCWLMFFRISCLFLLMFPNLEL